MKNILITCDDGINSPGLLACKKAVERLGSVYIYAPTKQRTCSSGSFTVGKPVKFYKRILQDGTPAIAVDGTPVDAVRFAVLNDLDTKPDLVISGINIGEQISAIATFVSGTAGAAYYAASKGIPALVVGYKPHNEDAKYTEHFQGAELEELSYVSEILSKIVNWVLKNDLMGADFWNINFPSEPTDKIRVVKMVDTGYYADTIKRKKNSFINFSVPTSASHKTDTDARWISRAITITPCKMNFTDERCLKELGRVKFEENIIKK
ncbi:MAG: 5'/3'-nucleotidase SurE [Nanoarchaeota archaeon]|nr:5'/3'-nucleotidase SurE [Nanoarchaeota archaeon]